MGRQTFIAQRGQQWQRLETLLKRKMNRLSGHEVIELGDLYLAATSDLAVARRDFPNDPVTTYLNELVARAHPIVYQRQGTTLRRIGIWVRYGFPQAYRDAGPYTAVAFAAFALGAVIAAVLVAIHPLAANVLLPGEAQSLRSVMQHHHLWMKANTANHPVAANFIMVNNIRVALLAFAGGILVCLPAVYVEALNGIDLGAVSTMAAQYGLAEGFWSFVVPHGVIELSVIFMSGGAGIMLGDSVLRPGQLRRRDALARAARTAMQITIGGACLLVVAGTIEGFFSASSAPDWSKFMVGALSGVLLYAYLLGSRPRIVETRYRFEDVLAPLDARPS